MNRKTLGGLIVLNIALLAGLAMVSFLPAKAQAQLGAGRAGDYVMIGLNAPGRQAYNAVLITDLNRAAMLAVRYDPSSKQVVPVAFRDLSRDAEARQSR